MTVVRHLRCSGTVATVKNASSDNTGEDICKHQAGRFQPVEGPREENAYLVASGLSVDLVVQSQLLRSDEVSEISERGHAL
jgi:hypothetical protein